MSLLSSQQKEVPRVLFEDNVEKGAPIPSKVGCLNY